MRILHVNRSLDPAQGGPVTTTLEISAQLITQGHHVEVVTIDDPRAAYLRYFPMPVHAIGGGRGKYGFNPELPRWIATNARRFDVAVLHGVWDYASYGGYLGAKRAQLPYVIYPHGMLDPWFRRGRPVKHTIKQAYWLVAGGHVLRHAVAVLFTCEEERRLARGSFFGPAYNETVVAFGAPDMPATAADQVAVFRRAMPALADRRYLLFLGRIHPKKGGDLLLQAFAALAGRYPGIDLVLAGPDDMGLQDDFADYLAQRQLSQRIHWPGLLGRELKWGALIGAEAFVLPSHQENFGIAVAEAMACSTPVVVSDKVNIWREIAKGGGGVVGEDTISGITTSLTWFLDLPDDARLAMGNSARQTYERHFTVEAAAQALIDVLVEAVTPHRQTEASA